ncbi:MULTISPECIES: hypothetical protein [unclassified Mycobacterium]|uniref:hypothetical protein n=1 Tax=unclassified Mycobacterium TaxID=2642494 RepID=UPI0006DC591D|nr:MULTISPECIES: hypothetical protein [unclassified Mycobacterium]OBF03502.1 hypothetical protein A5730_21950 [Mycobacterium sp. ACS4054]OBG70102.1 hypothetical protein A5702_11060 [Mycobacterium sp. E3339]OBH90573.1 hypothetical protein A5680_18530 [Mycobacterium sp. E2989]
MGSEKWPSEVWAVEYATLTGEREVAVMAGLSEALMWMDNLARTSAASPVLLRSDTRFERFSS